MTGVPSDIDLEKYADLLGRAIEPHLGLALCQPEGALLASTRSEGDSGIRAAVERLTQQGFAWSTAREGCVGLGPKHALLIRPLREPGGEVGLWLVCLVEQVEDSLAEEGHEKLLHGLGAIGRCIRDEFRLNLELDSIAAELSDRYEELNLVYHLEGHGGDADTAIEGIHAILRNLTTYLAVELVAFIGRDPSECIFETHPQPSIEGVDLIVSQLRGDVYRFVTTARKPLVLNDAGDPRRAYLFKHIPHKLLACPAVSSDGTEGILALVRSQAGEDFSNSDRNLAKLVVDQAALIMRNHSLVRQMRCFNQQLAASLIEAIEAKDPYTRGHSERVQGVATKVGAEMGLEERALEELFWGSLLHDVGKIGVPDAILCKPGRLSEDEFTLIKIHPERGYEILRHIEYLGERARAGVRYHHERIDGKGYPKGLAGREIPIGARIIAVADTYDAMTSSRSYRTARPHEVAVAEIERVSGTQLDSDAVRAFLRLCQHDNDWLIAVAARGSSIPGVR